MSKARALTRRNESLNQGALTELTPDEARGVNGGSATVAQAVAFTLAGYTKMVTERAMDLNQLAPFPPK